MTLEEVRAMTPRQKNEKLAELTGIEILAIKGFAKPMGRTTGDWFILPDYCNDLQAVHDAEATLTNEQQDAYIDRMIESIVIPFEAEYGVKLSDTDITWTVLHANANQRTAALILTLSTQR